MSGCDDDREEYALVQYSGIPNTPNVPGEKGRWRRFLELVMPWLEQKWALGEAVLEARVNQERARARQMMAEAKSAEVRVAQDVLKTLAMARTLEESKTPEGGVSPATPAEIEAEMEALKRKLEALGWKHGTSFHFTAESASLPAQESNTPTAPASEGVEP